jgi:DNA-binding transcriptional ArsR family regulator
VTIGDKADSVTIRRGKMSGMQSVASDAEKKIRLAEFVAQDRDRAVADEAGRKGNRDFVQVYPRGWKRLQSLIRTNPSAARVFAFLAEHIDGSCGAVVVSQELMATELDVHERTIRRLTQQLEDAGAIVRIRVGTGVLAYALDPEEVWKSWDDKKDLAAFVTKTLVLKSDRANGQVRRKLKVMLGEPELPLGDA